jgi:hypothetical protein
MIIAQNKVRSAEHNLAEDTNIINESKQNLSLLLTKGYALHQQIGCLEFINKLPKSKKPKNIYVLFEILTCLILQKDTAYTEEVCLLWEREIDAIFDLLALLEQIIWTEDLLAIQTKARRIFDYYNNESDEASLVMILLSKWVMLLCKVAKTKSIIAEMTNKYLKVPH